MTPQISILTPSYNYGRFVGDCIVSVERQSGPPAEQVIFDGGSSDETVAVLQEAAAGSLRWWSQPDDGQSDALSKAFRESQGEWVGWLNADEFYLPNAFSRVREVMAARPDIDVIYGDFFEVDADGNGLRLVPQHTFSKWALDARCYVPSCTVFMRRSAMPAELWDVNCRSMMDWDLFLRMQRRGSRFEHIKAPLAAFRVHEAQVSVGAGAQSAAEFELIRGRHGLRTRGVGQKAQRARGRGVHISRKLWEGGYLLQLRAAAVKGVSLRWFTDEDERRVTAVLADVYRQGSEARR